MENEWKVFAIAFGLMFFILIGAAVAGEINKGRLAECLEAKKLTAEQCKEIFEI